MARRTTLPPVSVLMRFVAVLLASSLTMVMVCETELKMVIGTAHGHAESEPADGECGGRSCHADERSGAVEMLVEAAG